MTITKTSIKEYLKDTNFQIKCLKCNSLDTKIHVNFNQNKRQTTCSATIICNNCNLNNAQIFSEYHIKKTRKEKEEEEKRNNYYNRGYD